MMPSPWATILLYLTVLSSATGYKHPLPDQSFLTDPHNREEYSSPPLVFEWKTQDKSDKTLLTLIRMVREISDKKKAESQPDKKFPSKTEKVTKSPLEKSPGVSPLIVLPSQTPYKKPPVMEQLDDEEEDETTPSSELNHTSTKVKLIGAETTQTDKSPTAAIKTISTQTTLKSTQEQLSTQSPTKSEDLPVFTKNTVNEATTSGPIHSTINKVLSSIPDSTSKKVEEKNTETITSKIPTDTPPKPILTSAEPTTHGKTTGLIPDSSTTPVPVTHTSTISEDKISTQSLMKQCMLTILILAVVCTIFIITTIALAAKLSTMRQRQKLRHPATYTEMRCISSLLPDNDQQSKVKPKRLRTFAAPEESDGDNTTLNSFLPDH
ncbi:P-selectin glycoprotein ligand 1 [Rana temporaria]|uniref:P-selectin glycoprotein ligand 1 n=1 Tax=Rana temporaria TaxID=8407 RepID=UPI001AAD0DCB|nr:P-selectin glycoprotein ligand 1 [Rana temporaria]